MIKSGPGNGTIISSPAGIDCGDMCSAFIAENSVISFNAIPDGASRFAGWSNDCIGLSECKITMDADKKVTARFELAGKISLPLIMR